MPDLEGSGALDSNILRSARLENATTEDLLREILSSLDSLSSDGINISQSALNDMRNGGTSRSSRSDRWKTNRRNNSTVDSYDDWGQRSRTSTSFRKLFSQFTDSIEDSLVRSLTGDPIGKDLSKSLANFANSMGVSVDQLGVEAGKMLGEQLSSVLGNNKWVKGYADKVKDFKSEINSQLNDIINQAATKIRSTGKSSGFTFSDLMNGGSSPVSDTSVIEDVGSNILQGKFGDFAKNITKGSEAVTGALSKGPQSLGPMIKSLGGPLKGLAKGALKAAPPLIAIEIASDLLALAIADVAKNAKELKEDFNNLKEAAHSAANQQKELRKALTKGEIERMSADFEVMITKSYDIMQEAADKMIASWDSSLQVITATQGYTKGDMQDLISNYAQRLRDNNLSSVVSAADLTDNLSKVLSSGLSGKVAEEFAYQATVLNAAVPTEDFFSYASTYASIAANAISNGQAEADAIQYANEELKKFASNLLYSSRELAGGFSSGLTNASSLLSDAVKIATTSKIGDASTISAVLTSVSAIVGAVAPDLASDLVGSVVSAAIGGNDSRYTALRSLAGTGAANTAFLTALAKDPQQVFATMFSNLANLQQMSNDNFMEVAEGLSGVFGVSMDAFARVDFNYLANAISQMNAESNALGQNIALLKSGQTTSTAEQMRMQKINEYMIDEGLAYVLDNEAARAIQENMWAEQRAIEIKENEYAVNLKGSALEVLTSLGNTVESILDIINPFAWAKKITDLVTTAGSSGARDSDILRVLEAGKVGRGNVTALKQLTTRGEKLNLTSDYASLLTGRSEYSDVSNYGLLGNGLLKAGADAISSMLDFAANGVANSRQKTSLDAIRSGVTSKYKWATVGKSLSDAITNSQYNTGNPYVIPASGSLANATSTRMQDYLNTIQSFVKDNKTYEDWASEASKYGIANLSDALESNGLSVAAVQEQFQKLEAQKAAEYEHERDVKEEKLWDNMILWLEETYPEDKQVLWDYQSQIISIEQTLVERADMQILQLIAANNELKEFYNSWVDYYVNHTAYSQETLHAYDVQAIRRAEASETGDAVLALANALTSNQVDLKDPVAQQNVLLSKILLSVQAIMQQNNNTSTVSLPTTLAALGLGVTS